MAKNKDEQPEVKAEGDRVEETAAAVDFDAIDLQAEIEKSAAPELSEQEKVAEVQRVAKEAADAEHAEYEKLLVEEAAQNEAKKAADLQTAEIEAEARRAEIEQANIERLQAAEEEQAAASALAAYKAESESALAQKLADEADQAEKLEAENLAAQRAEVERLEAERIAAIPPFSVIANSDFVASINGILKRYKLGDMETDFTTANYLLDSGCDVRLAGETEHKRCPNCSHVFRAEVPVVAVEAAVPEVKE